MQESVVVQKAALRKLQRAVDDAQSSGGKPNHNTQNNGAVEQQQLRTLQEEAEEIQNNIGGQRMAITHLEQEREYSWLPQRTGSPPPPRGVAPRPPPLLPPTKTVQS